MLCRLVCVRRMAVMGGFAKCCRAYATRPAFKHSLLILPMRSNAPAAPGPAKSESHRQRVQPTLLADEGKEGEEAYIKAIDRHRPLTAAGGIMSTTEFRALAARIRKAFTFSQIKAYYLARHPGPVPPRLRTGRLGAAAYDKKDDMLSRIVRHCWNLNIVRADALIVREQRKQLPSRSMFFLLQNKALELQRISHKFNQSVAVDVRASTISVHMSNLDFSDLCREIETALAKMDVVSRTVTVPIPGAHLRLPAKKTIYELQNMSETFADAVFDVQNGLKLDLSCLGPSSRAIDQFVARLSAVCDCMWRAQQGHLYVEDRARHLVSYMPLSCQPSVALAFPAYKTSRRFARMISLEGNSGRLPTSDNNEFSRTDGADADMFVPPKVPPEFADLPMQYTANLTHVLFPCTQSGTGEMQVDTTCAIAEADAPTLNIQAVQRSFFSSNPVTVTDMIQLELLPDCSHVFQFPKIHIFINTKTNKVTKAVAIADFAAQAKICLPTSPYDIVMSQKFDITEFVRDDLQLTKMVQKLKRVEWTMNWIPVTLHALASRFGPQAARYYVTRADKNTRITIPGNSANLHLAYDSNDEKQRVSASIDSAVCIPGSSDPAAVWRTTVKDAVAMIRAMTP